MMTAASPFEQWSMPAAMATWLPKLRGKRIAVTRASRPRSVWQHLERSVGAAVVHEHELPVVLPEIAHDPGDVLVKAREVVLLVVDGDDDRDQRFRHRQRVTSRMTVSMTRA